MKNRVITNEHAVKPMTGKEAYPYACDCSVWTKQAAKNRSHRCEWCNCDMYLREE